MSGIQACGSLGVAATFEVAEFRPIWGKLPAVELAVEPGFVAAVLITPVVCPLVVGKPLWLANWPPG
jgi:hypothetical protein